MWFEVENAVFQKSLLLWYLIEQKSFILLCGGCIGDGSLNKKQLTHVSNYLESTTFDGNLPISIHCRHTC
jgi:hypothetical protein